MGVDRVNLNQNWRVFQVACVYIGTVVGAGFASGREIYQFFVRFGNLGYIGIGIATILFAWFGYRMMKLGRILGAESFRDMNAYLFGRWFSHIIDTLSVLMLFGVTVAMLAGAGELFKERIGLHFMLGVIGTVIIAFLTLLKGMSGILESNTIIVPVMVSFVVYAFFHSIFDAGIVHPIVVANHIASSPSLFPMFLSSLVYSALNIGLSAGILVPLGAQVNDDAILKRGAILGALGLGMMLVFVTFSLFAYGPEVFRYEVPMAFVATKLGPILQWLFVIVLWGEIFSTLVGNVYGLSAQLTGRSQLLITMYTGSLLIVAVLCSQIGFSNIVAYGYTIFGWVSLLMLIALCKPIKSMYEI